VIKLYWYNWVYWSYRSWVIVHFPTHPFTNTSSELPWKRVNGWKQGYMIHSMRLIWLPRYYSFFADLSNEIPALDSPMNETPLAPPWHEILWLPPRDASDSPMRFWLLIIGWWETSRFHSSQRSQECSFEPKTKSPRGPSELETWYTDNKSFPNLILLCFSEQTSQTLCCSSSRWV
jgi:hypothetical protein